MRAIGTNVGVELDYGKIKRETTHVASRKQTNDIVIIDSHLYVHCLLLNNGKHL